MKTNFSRTYAVAACIAIGLSMILLSGGTAYGQNAHQKHVVAKSAKPVVKRKVVRKANRIRKKRVRRSNVVLHKVPPRDPNRFTVIGEPVNRYTIMSADPPPDYPGPLDNASVNRERNMPAGQMPAVPKQISGGVLNGKARVLPVPVYPPAARAVRATGAISVQVLIDEDGNVISAIAVSGNPLLRAASVQAARGAKFAPTKLAGNPVKVSGIITYNFVP